MSWLGNPMTPLTHEALLHGRARRAIAAERRPGRLRRFFGRIEGAAIFTAWGGGHVPVDEAAKGREDDAAQWSPWLGPF